MGKMELDDFIKYAKEKFGCEVSVKMCEKPDTFADIFGASFLNDNEYMENIDDFEDELKCGLYLKVTWMSNMIVI